MAIQPPQPPNGPALLQALKLLEKSADARMELLNHQSNILRAKFNLCIDKGFDERQALFLCTQDWGHAL